MWEQMWGMGEEGGTGLRGPENSLQRKSPKQRKISDFDILLGVGGKSHRIF